MPKSDGGRGAIPFEAGLLWKRLDEVKRLDDPAAAGEAQLRSSAGATSAGLEMLTIALGA